MNGDDFTFDEYQSNAVKTMVFPRVFVEDDTDSLGYVEVPWLYPVLGLAGEAGEIAEKLKHVLRDNKGHINAAQMTEIGKELGDQLWYIAIIAHKLGLSLSKIAKFNNEKLLSRQKRGKLLGRGDNR